MAIELRGDEHSQGGLILEFRIEPEQPVGLRGAEEALVGRNQREVVAGGAEPPSDGQR